MKVALKNWNTHEDCMLEIHDVIWKRFVAFIFADVFLTCICWIIKNVYKYADCVYARCSSRFLNFSFNNYIEKRSSHEVRCLSNIVCSIGGKKLLLSYSLKKKFILLHWFLFKKMLITAIENSKILISCHYHYLPREIFLMKKKFKAILHALILTLYWNVHLKSIILCVGKYLIKTKFDNLSL